MKPSKPSANVCAMQIDAHDDFRYPIYRLKHSNDNIIYMNKTDVLHHTKIV